MTTHKEALEAAYLAGFNASGEGYNGEYPFGDKKQDPAENPAWRKDCDNYIKEALAQPEQERCVGCEACIDTACGRDECPKGWPKAAQPEQEPVAWMNDSTPSGIFARHIDGARNFGCTIPLYTTPPQRKPLTDEEIGAILEGVNAYGTRLYTFARAIEAKLKDKNT